MFGWWRCTEKRGEFVHSNYGNHTYCPAAEQFLRNQRTNNSSLCGYSFFINQINQCVETLSREKDIKKLVKKYKQTNLVMHQNI